MKKLLVVLAMSATFLGLAATPVSATTIKDSVATVSAKPEQVQKAYVPIYGCQDFYFGLWTPGVFYDGHNSRFQSGTYRTGADQSCNGGQVRANLIEWIPMPPPGFRCGYIMPARYTLSGVFISNGIPVRICPGGPPVSLGTYGGNTRLGFRWWTEYPQYNNDQRWANLHLRF